MGLLDKAKSFFTIDEEEYENEGFDVQQSDEEEKGILKPSFMKVKQDNITKIENSYTSKDVKVIIFEPEEYNEALNIVDSLKNKRIVVVNFSNMKATEGKTVEQNQKQIFDFINGAVYAMDGNINQMSSTIFVMTPNNVEMDMGIKKEMSRRGNVSRWG